jgi:subtilase family serine protease
MKIRSPAWMLLAPFLILGSAQGGHGVRLDGHVALEETRQARHLGRLSARTMLDLAVALKPRDANALADLVKRQQDPTDPEYHRFLTSDEFRERFSPTQQDVDQVVAYLRAQGFTEVRVHENRLVVNARASAAAAEDAFHIELHEFRTVDGRRVRAPSDDPQVDEAVAARVHAIAGLSTFRHWRTHKLQKLALDTADAAPRSINSYMTPSKIKSVYGLSTAATAGAGETLALFELDGYNGADIATYASQFSITAPPLENVLVDGASGAAGANQDEVCLDIELAMAVSPGLAKIQVYEGPNTDAGVLDTYSRIASDNTAKAVSTSWGATEGNSTNAYLQAENTIFQQMAAQGQSVFAAAGDAGAFDDSAHPNTLAVDDPASQPYVTAVGGTTLSQAAGNYVSESSWGANGSGGGGGISAVWSQPSWQADLARMANKGSHTRRMVPDVAFDADPSTGYSIRTEGGWFAIGGTSAAAPIWAAIAAQVNQARVANSLARLGFANPALYQLAQSSLYGATFHDIADGSTNLYFPATTAYDLSTGLGTPKGAALVAALAASDLPPTPPATVQTNGVGGNSVLVSWSGVGGATSYTVYRSSSFSGTYIGIGTTATQSYTDTVGGASYYYYVVATNAVGSSGPSAKRAGSANLAAPGTTTGLATSEAP